MADYTSEQLQALLAGQLTPEAEAEIARDIELDPQLRCRLELLSGSSVWTIGSAPVPAEPTSSKLDSVIERVVAESFVERVGSGSATVQAIQSDETETQDRLAVPGIRIVREIGRGGMGIVYEGWDELVGRKVAIKRMLPIIASSSNAKERSLQEARAAGSLQHPNIVSIYSVHIQDDLPILVQQYVEGETLQSRIDDKRYLSWQECVEFAKQISAGLEAAHAAGIVHRDLKPDNILIEASTHAVLIADFGIARHSSSSRLTAHDKVAGTPAFMSPEQTTGEQVDARSDLFSLGSVLFAAATGTPPFGINDPFVVMNRIRNQAFVSLKTLRPDYPEWLSDIFDRLLAKDPSQRTESAAVLTSSLANHTALTAMSAQRRLSRKWLVMALTLLAAMFGVVFWLTKPKSDQLKNASNAQSPETTGKSAFVPHKPIWIRRTQSEFDSLSTAVQAAADGDTIEIGEDIECRPLHIHAKNLTLKGAATKRPVLRSAERSDSNHDTHAYFIRSDLDLSLEGIEIDWQTEADATFLDEGRANAVVSTAPGARLTIRDCTISRGAKGACVSAGGNLVAQRTTIRSEGVALMWLSHHARASLDHCVLDGRIGIGIVYPVANAAVFKRSQLKIKNSTLRAEDAISALLSRRPEEAVEIEILDTILDSEHTVSLIAFSNFVGEQLEVKTESWLKSCMLWQEARCVHDANCKHLITRRFLNIERYTSSGISNLSQWLTLVSGGQSQSISAKLTRLADGQNSQARPAYKYEPTSQNQLPDWIDRVGPTATSQFKP